MNEDIVPFKCPSCGGEQFKTAREVKSYQDLTGAICTDCGRAIADDDIKKHAVGLVRQGLRDAFKGLKR